MAGLVSGLVSGWVRESGLVSGWVSESGLVSGWVSEWFSKWLG